MVVGKWSVLSRGGHATVIGRRRSPLCSVRREGVCHWALLLWEASFSLCRHHPQNTYFHLPSLKNDQPRQCEWPLTTGSSFNILWAWKVSFPFSLARNVLIFVKIGLWGLISKKVKTNSIPWQRILSSYLTLCRNLRTTSSCMFLLRKRPLYLMLL